jgi:hypothetical protein
MEGQMPETPVPGGASRFLSVLHLNDHKTLKTAALFMGVLWLSQLLLAMFAGFLSISVFFLSLALSAAISIGLSRYYCLKREMYDTRLLARRLEALSADQDPGPLPFDTQDALLKATDILRQKLSARQQQKILGTPS